MAEKSTSQIGMNEKFRIIFLGCLSSVVGKKKSIFLENNQK